MQNWLEIIRDNPEAAARLEKILNHTHSTDDGEQFYVPAEELAEVYAILFTAWSAGADDLAQLVENPREDGCVIADYNIVRLVGLAEEDIFQVSALSNVEELPREEVAVEIDLV